MHSKIRLMTRASLAALAFGAGAAAWTSANAQTGAAAASTDSTILEDVVVTARRTEERLQEVPVSVTAVTGQQLQEANVVNVLDLNRVTPGLSVVAPSGPRQNFSFLLRGQIAGTATYFDEVPVLFGGFGSPLPLYDLENVQVLRGPQGTLFGVNSTGGALLVQPKRPTNDFGGDLTVQLGRFWDREISGGVGGPIVADKLLFRVAGEYRRREGYSRNAFNGAKLDDLDRWSVRGTLVFKPTENFENSTVLSFQNIDETGTSIHVVAVRTSGPGSSFVTPFVAQLQQQIAAGRGKNQSANMDNPTIYYSKSTRLSNITTWTPMENLVVKNIFGWQRVEGYQAWENDGSTFPIQQLVIPPPQFRHGGTDSTTDEVQVRLNNLFDNRLDLLGGFFYRKNDPEGGLVSTRANTFLPVPFNLLPFVPSFAPLIPNAFAYPPGTVLITDILGRATLKQTAFYAHADFKLTDTLHLSGGVRRTHQENQNERYGTTKAASANPTVILLGKTAHSESAWSWDGTVNWDVAPDKMVYATVRRGYNAGGSNTSAPASRPDLLQFKPEFVTDFEAGLKADWTLGGGARLRTNIAAYWDRYSNKQETVFPPSNSTGASSTTTITINAAKARIRGIDFDGAVILNEMFDASFFYSLTDAKYTNFLDQASPPPAVAINRKGQRLADAPKHKLGITPHVHIPLSGDVGNLDFQVQYTWQSDIAPRIRQEDYFPKGYSLVNIRADVRHIGGSGVSVGAFVTNVFDKVYTIGFTPILAVSGVQGETRGDPRMWGATLRYEF